MDIIADVGVLWVDVDAGAHGEIPMREIEGWRERRTTSWGLKFAQGFDMFTPISHHDDWNQNLIQKGTKSPITWIKVFVKT